jgi:hypothetical protein
VLDIEPTAKLEVGDRSRGCRCSLRSRERCASCRLYRYFARRSKDAGAGVSETWTKAGSPHEPMTVISLFIGGARSCSNRFRTFTRLMNSDCFLSRSTAGGTPTGCEQ